MTASANFLPMQTQKTLLMTFGDSRIISSEEFLIQLNGKRLKHFDGIINPSPCDCWMHIFEELLLSALCECECEYSEGRIDSLASVVFAVE
jgi:hypothetical protein